MEKLSVIYKEFLSITFLLIISISLFAQYSGGTGAEDNPYQISILEDLRTLTQTPDDFDKHFILTADIDATDTKNWNDGSGFSPIGQYGSTFTGHFDGQDHTISNLYISRLTTYNVGLFGIVNKAIIKNLKLDNFDIEGRSIVGGLVGTIGQNGSSPLTEISNISISNCNIRGQSNVGGLAGQIDSGSIYSCSVSGKISASFSIIGGLVGNTYGGYGAEIINCIVAVEVTGAKNVGGLVGINQITITDCQVQVQARNITALYYGSFGGLTSSNIGNISNCFVGGEILIEGSGYDYIGGLVAINSGTIQNCNTSVQVVSAESNFVGGLAGENEKTIKNCFSSATVTGLNCVGGLVGINTHGSQTINCYATGVITGVDKTGGLIGENSYFGTIINSYSSGEVICDEWFSGGLVGLNRSTANTINCFFDNESSGYTIGIGMDHNGQNQQPNDLTTNEFNNQSFFLDAEWIFGNSIQSPWKMGTAADYHKRPVLYYQNYTIIFESGEGGVLSPDSLQNQTVNCSSNSKAVLAIPNDGFAFSKWQNPNGDSLTIANPIIIENVVSDSTLIAVFESIYGLKENMASYFRVYPNPAQSAVKIDLGNSYERVTMIIKDMNGKLMVKEEFEGIEEIDLNIENYINGVYFITLIADRKLGNYRIIKL